MRILMLGNSFTYCNDLPAKLSALTGAKVVSHTRGGACLSEHLNTKTEMGAKTLVALQDDTWDYVILQEKSNAPIKSKKTFLKSVSKLCEKIREAGAVPVLYSTWAYHQNSTKLSKLGLSYEVMTAQLSAAYHEAAEQNDALIADVGLTFYHYNQNKNLKSATNVNIKKSDTCEPLYAADGIHPSEAGTRLAAETIAEVILKDQRIKKKSKSPDTLPAASSKDPRLRLLYLYRLLHRHTDSEHPLSTNQIRLIMEKKYGITMHRTTVPSDVALLQAAGIPIYARRSSVMLYYMEETFFELPELKILIDAVESSKFITEVQCRGLVEKLLSLTSENNAEKLHRNLYTSGRVRSGNEKGYYIVDAINEAINEKRQISFFYTEFNEKKQIILRNDGHPYTVSPYTLIWNGDYYYLVGFYHQKNRISTFRVDRILMQPDILPSSAEPAPKDFNILRYTKEIFRMYDNQEQQKVTLLCDNSVMKGVIDQFGTNIAIKCVDQNHFSTKVIVCTSQTFYAWIFQWKGAIKIEGPKGVVEEYRKMARAVLEE